MAKKDDRPIDVGLAALVGKDEGTAIEFWTNRFTLTAAIPNEIARVGALTPQIRELVRVSPESERERLTRARLIAFSRLPPDQRDRITAARKAAWEVDRRVLEKDQELVDRIIPTLAEDVRAAYPKR